jgi:RHS repeat-associated protein
LPETRVWGSNEKILLHFRATLLLSEKQHSGYKKCRRKKAVGSVVTYDYDAFGNLVHQTGSTPNNYLFAGEQFDPDLNLYYNRARYLNVSTGRFWSMDTLEGVGDEPLSLHKYLYTEADPVDNVDPSGNEETTTIGQLASLPVAQTIAVLSIITLTGVCSAFAIVLHGPGFCGSKYNRLILYRGLSGKNPGQLKPEYFSGDGLSLYESLLPRYKYVLPFVIDYLEPKTAGTRAAHIYVPPFLGEIADITYTPEWEDPTIGKGHWSLQLKLGIALTADILKLLIDYMKGGAI